MKRSQKKENVFDFVFWFCNKKITRPTLFVGFDVGFGFDLDFDFGFGFGFGQKCKQTKSLCFLTAVCKCFFFFNKL